VSSGVGSLTINSDPAYAHRSIFDPVYPASKTALNAMTLAMAIELESTEVGFQYKMSLGRVAC
jgi:NAD(P)-dependent dehydrogenase (short-subunit alcohol dehydrogenase family)